MIDPTWRRIGAIHHEDDGRLGAVWVALDRSSNVLHLYDVAMFHTEPRPVIADGISARGRRYPIAWRKKDKAFAEELKSQGVKMLHDPVEESPGTTEVVSREIQQQLRSSRFRVAGTARAWLDEYDNFFNQGQKVPDEGFPLMAATRHAVMMVRFAKAEQELFGKRRNHPNIKVM